MKSIKNMWRYSIMFLLVIAACDTYAQNVVFSANVNAEKIGLQDQLQLVYTVQNANSLQNVQTPNDLVRNFDLVGGPFESRSTQVSIVGNRMVQSSSVTLTYVLQPKRTGKFTIAPGVAKDADGNTYRSNELRVEVVQGSVAQQQPQEEKIDEADIGKDLFIRVNVDKNKVHVGEQITASYKLYARIPMNVSISKLPSLNGFWTQDFDIPKTNIKPTEEVINGKKYQVFLLKKSALFPQQTGTLELDPAEAEGTARVMHKTRQRNPFGDMFDDDPFFNSLMMSDPFFDDEFFSSFSYRDVKVSLKSQPVKISVQPLPEKGRPADYGGAVGNFTMSSKVDKTELTTDEIATITLTIKGSGNFKLIDVPKLTLPNGLSTFDPQVIDTITGRSTTISGSKIITYSITPGTPGTYNVPPLSFSYFNPATNSYVTLSSNAVKLNVKPGKGYKAGSNKTNVALTDIHFVNTAPLKDLTFNSRPLFFTATYWSLYALPLFAFIGVIVWRRREDELSKDTVKLKHRRANKIALKRLSVAQKLLQQNDRKLFYEEISKAIWLYLSDKLNIPLSALSHEAAQDGMTARGVPDSLQKQVSAVTTECEAALYAPTGGTQQMNHVYQEAIHVISKLEEAFNS